MIDHKLQNFGLNEKEAKVYIASLELGETTIERISKKSGIKRTTLYDVIESLMKKGMIGSTIKNKKKNFFACDPRELEEKLDQKKTVLKSIMPYLLSISGLIDKKSKVRFFEGIEGIKEIHFDTLKFPDQPIHAWITDEINDVLEPEFIDFYLKKLLKNKIWLYAIAPNSKTSKEYQKMDFQSLRKTKIDTLNNPELKVEIDLYGGSKIGIMSFKEGIGFIIESPKIYETLKSIFDAHWNSLN